MTKSGFFTLVFFLATGMMAASNVADANLEVTIAEHKSADAAQTLEPEPQPQSVKSHVRKVAEDFVSEPLLDESDVGKIETAPSEAPLEDSEREGAEKNGTEEERSEEGGNSGEEQSEETEKSEDELEQELPEKPEVVESEEIEKPEEELGEEQSDESEKNEFSEAPKPEDLGEAAEEDADISPEEPLTEVKEFQWDFGLLFDMESGDMTYTIEGPGDGGWKSKLEWPLDNVIYAGVEASLNFREKWRIHAELLKAVSDDAGTLKDSDWFYGYYDDRVAIYSETSSSLDAYVLDMSLEYRFWRRSRISAGGLLGYSYKHWDWTGGSGYQWTIDPFSHYEGPIKGSAVTYKENVYIPYLGLKLGLLSEKSKFEADLSTLYSPFAVCKDESDHLLRKKKGEGYNRGNFFALRANVRWWLNAHWSFGARTSVEFFDLEGDQTQLFYGGEYAGTGAKGIDMSVEGTQRYVGLTVGYSF